MLEEGRDRYRKHLGAILELREPLLRIPATADPAADGAAAGEPTWVNGWLPGLDSAALYTILARTDPALYLEVGSGNSTKFARRAIEDHGLRTRLVSIDPQPRAEIDALCDEVVRSPADPLAALVGAQLLAVALDERNGLDPDAPRNLTRSIILPA